MFYGDCLFQVNVVIADDSLIEDDNPSLHPNGCSSLDS